MLTSFVVLRRSLRRCGGVGGMDLPPPFSFPFAPSSSSTQPLHFRVDWFFFFWFSENWSFGKFFLHFEQNGFAPGEKKKDKQNVAVRDPGGMGGGA